MVLGNISDEGPSPTVVPHQMQDHGWL